MGRSVLGNELGKPAETHSYQDHVHKRTGEAQIIRLLHSPRLFILYLLSAHPPRQEVLETETATFGREEYVEREAATKPSGGAERCCGKTSCLSIYLIMLHLSGSRAREVNCYVLKDGGQRS